MSVILHVNYTPSAAQQAQPHDERVASAKRIRELDGFGWKVWVRNAETGERGGIYLFDDRASAEAWGEQAKARLTAGGGTGLTLTYFDIDPELSALTLAPLERVKEPA